MGTRIKPGRTLEKLVSILERVLSGTQDVLVESPKHLPDRVTGNPREHDVVVTVRDGHREVIHALECRDRSRKVQVGDIEAFHAKCLDTGVDVGYIVSPRGFYRSAKAKAARYNIRCLSLSEAKSFDWMRAEVLQTRWREGISVSVEFGLDDPSRVVEPYRVINRLGAEVNHPDIAAYLWSLFDKLPGLPESPGEHSRTYQFATTGLKLIDAKGESFDSDSIRVTYCFRVHVSDVPFKLVSYHNEEQGLRIADAAVAEVNMGPFKGQLVVTQEAGKVGKVVLIPGKRTA